MLLFWWADVLTIYAVVGIHLAFLTLIGGAMERLSLYVCLVWFYLFVLVITCFSIGPLAQMAERELSPPPIKVASEGPPISLIHGRESWDTAILSYFHPNNQLRIYRNGSLADVIEHRVLLHVKEVLAAIIFYFWYMLGCAPARRAFGAWRSAR